MPDTDKVPQHVAIIMDGNGRWAKRRGLPRTIGHHEGINRIKEIVQAASDLGIKVLTLFTFSTENWSRPKREIDLLMHSLDRFLKNESQKLNKNNIRFSVIGRDEPLPKYLQSRLKEVIELTSKNNGLIVNLALNYGGRQEIVDATKKIIDAVLDGRINKGDLDEQTFSQFFYKPELAEPDLLIRTSGEMRISNFLLWQLSYSELYFTKKFWPDFTKSDLIRAIEEYQKRERRFGNIDVNQKDN